MDHVYKVFMGVSNNFAVLVLLMTTIIYISKIKKEKTYKPLVHEEEEKKNYFPTIMFALPKK